MSVMRAAGAIALWLTVAGCVGHGDGERCGPREAVVDRVIDGDTIVAGGRTLRYLLVDAPETTGGHADCYGDNAAQFNADLVVGRTVELDYDTDCDDRFGRTLAFVRVGGRDISRLLVERGYACVLHIPPDGDDRADEFAAAQAAAKIARRGLWGACDPTPCR